MPHVFRRRRAARFADLVDQPKGLRHQQPVDQHLADLADVTDDLRRAGDTAPTPDPGFSADLRAMLIATAERDGIGDTGEAETPVPPERPPRRPRLLIAAGVAVGVAAGVVSLSAASGSAVPGDSLYSLKRSAEQAHLAVTLSDAERGSLYLELARNRMHEAARMSGNPTQIHGILTDMDIDTRNGVKLLTTTAVTGRNASLLDTVTGFVHVQSVDMTRMMAALTGPAHDRAITSKVLLDAAGIRADLLRRYLSCTTLPAAQVDHLGPQPQECPAPRGTQQQPPLRSAVTDPSVPPPAVASTAPPATGTVPPATGTVPGQPGVPLGPAQAPVPAVPPAPVQTPPPNATDGTPKPKKSQKSHPCKGKKNKDGCDESATTPPALLTVPLVSPSGGD